MSHGLVVMVHAVSGDWLFTGSCVSSARFYLLHSFFCTKGLQTTNKQKLLADIHVSLCTKAYKQAFILGTTFNILINFEQGLHHGRKDLVLQQLPVAELVDPLI